MSVEEQDTAWLLHNQASLERRLERVENSLMFRMLRAVGKWYRPRAGAASNYAEWRKRGGGTLPLPSPASHTTFTTVAADAPNIPAVLAASTADYIVFADRLDCMHPSALAHFAAAAPADLIYADEEILSPAGTPAEPRFRPDWSPVLFQSANYLGSLVAIRRELLLKQPDRDLAIRNGTVAHIPAILYSSRACSLPPLVTTDAPAASPGLVSVIVCTRTAHLLEACLAGVRQRTDSPNLELIVVQHLGSSTPREEASVASVITKYGATQLPYPGPFNFADMNNRAAQAASGDVLLFLNDDIDPIKPDWLRRMAARLLDPTVGAVGARLTFPDGTLQHAGIAAWMVDGAWHPGRRVPPSANWPWNAYTREVSAVTGACLAVRAKDFHHLGGFDPALAVNFNDVDLCFRLQQQKLSVIVDIEAQLRHDESRTRVTGVSYDERRHFFRKWAERLQRPDPFFTPHLVQNNEELALR